MVHYWQFNMAMVEQFIATQLSELPGHMKLGKLVCLSQMVVVDAS